MFFASGCAFFIAEKKVLVKMISSRRMGKASSFIENKAKKIYIHSHRKTFNCELLHSPVFIKSSNLPHGGQKACLPLVLDNSC